MKDEALVLYARENPYQFVENLRRLHGGKCSCGKHEGQSAGGSIR